MPEVASLVHVRTYPVISISVTNSDATDYTSAPVFADIPSSYIQALGCDWSNMRLEDENGNPITFWPDANGANEVYPGYYSIWFKIDLPASGTRTLRLYCDQSAPTYTSNPTDVVDIYVDYSSLDQLYSYSQYVTIDSSIYFDPPSSLCLLCKSNGYTNTAGRGDVQISYADHYIVKVEWYMEAYGTGNMLAHASYYNGNDSWCGPYVAFGGTTPYSSYGPYIYSYDTSWHQIGQYQADSKWHRMMLHVHAVSQTFDAYYDDSLLASGLAFRQGSTPFSSDATIHVVTEEDATATPDASNNHVDSFVYVAVPYTSMPSVLVSIGTLYDSSCLSELIDLT